MVLQSEAELLAEKKCVAHLTGEVIIMLPLTYTHAHQNHKYSMLIHLKDILLKKFLPHFARVLQSAIYPGTQCFLEKCRSYHTKVVFRIFAWYQADILRESTSGGNTVTTRNFNLCRRINLQLLIVLICSKVTNLRQLISLKWCSGNLYARRNMYI